MDTEAIFQRLGLGKHSSEAYDVLLASDSPMLLAHLARAMKVSRAQAYRNVAELIDARFVRAIPAGKRLAYVAESPDRIEEAFARVAKKVKATTERARLKREKDVPEYIRFFSGFSGIRAVFDDTIDHTPKGDTFYRYTSERDLEKVNKYLSSSYRARRDKKKLERLVISNPVSGKQKKSRLERFIQYIQPGTALFDQNIIQLTYGKRVAFINLNTETAFIIEDESLADFQKVIFRQLYRKLSER